MYYYFLLCTIALFFFFVFYLLLFFFFFFFFSSRRRHTRCLSDWSSDVCSSDLPTTCSSASKLAYIGLTLTRVVSTGAPGPAATRFPTVTSSLPTRPETGDRKSVV